MPEYHRTAGCKSHQSWIEFPFTEIAKRRMGRVNENRFANFPEDLVYRQRSSLAGANQQGYLISGKEDEQKMILDCLFYWMLKPLFKEIPSAYKTDKTVVELHVHWMHYLLWHRNANNTMIHGGVDHMTTHKGASAASTLRHCDAPNLTQAYNDGVLRNVR